MLSVLSWCPFYGGVFARRELTVLRVPLSLAQATVSMSSTVNSRRGDTPL